MKLDVYSTSGQVTGEIEVSDRIFAAEVKPHLFWEVVRWQEAKRHAGTHATKTRHTVSGTTQKAYRQKGTGRARHGSYKAPTFVGGGVAHGPQPRSYEFNVNKKARAAALRSALSMKVQEGKLRVLENFELSQIKTKEALKVLGALGAAKSLVIDDANERLGLSVRNLQEHKYLDAAGLNVRDMLRYDMLILTKGALEKVHGRLG